MIKKTLNVHQTSFSNISDYLAIKFKSNQHGKTRMKVVIIITTFMIFPCGSRSHHADCVCRFIWPLKAYCFPVRNISDKKFEKMVRCLTQQ